MQLLCIAVFCLITLIMPTASRSQTVAFNGMAATSGSPDAPGSDSKKQKNHSKSGPSVTITNNGLSDTLCVGQTYSINIGSSATGGTSPYTYAWSSNHGTAIGVTTNSSVDFYWVNPGVDTVRLVVTDAGGATVTDSIVITSVYCADFFANTYSVCLDTCVVFTDVSSGHPNWWKWTFGASNANATVNNGTSNAWQTNDTTLNDSMCVYFHTPGWQTVTLEIKNAGGFDTSKTKTQYIFVGACPHASYTSTIPANDTICACKCIQFTKNSITDPFSQSQKWYFVCAANAFFDTTREANPLICFPLPGWYHIYFADYNSVGKDSLYSDSLYVEACTKPATNILVPIGKDTICSGECITFDDASCNTPTKWKWAFQGGTPTSDTVQHPKEVCYFNYGAQLVTYQVKLVDTNAFGFDSAYVKITVRPNPKITLSSHPDGIINGIITIIDGTTVNITEGGNDPYPYYWSYTPQTYTDPDSLKPDTCNYPDNPVANPTTSHWYYVHTVGAGNSKGCVANDSVYIKVVKTSDIYVPNAFSPNGDGKDDYLYVRSNFIRTLYFAVYDRWGEKVWETSNQSVGWDGTYKGSPENNGVFDWYLKATMYNGKQVMLKGNTTLIR